MALIILKDKPLMSPLNTIRTIARDESDKQASKYWHSRILSEKIRSLRSLRHLTQAEVASRMGVSESAVRNYELMKALPSEKHIELMAKAFDVRPECLHLYDFGVSSILANSIFQLAGTYGLTPAHDDRFACLLPTSSFMSRFFDEWTYQYSGLSEGHISRESYELWKDTYTAEYDPGEFVTRYEGDSEEGSYILIPSWGAYCFSRKIKKLRESQGFTQAAFSTQLGIKEGVYRSYEQGRRLPRRSIIRGIADTLEITEGSLTFVDFGSPVQAAHALFQLASEYGLIPGEIDGKLVLRARKQSIEKIIDQWCLALDGVYEKSGWNEVDSFGQWRDKYDPDGPGISNWETRFLPHSVKQTDGSYLLDGNYESRFDPFDERYEEGFLKA